MPFPALSAHRCGAGRNTALENTIEALSCAAESGVEYVEFDVQRLVDGSFVLYHDSRVFWNGRRHRLDQIDLDFFESAVGRKALLYDDVLRYLAERHLKAHIDFKFHSRGSHEEGEIASEVQAAERALDIMGPNGFLLTTTEDHSVTLLRDWAKSCGLDDLLIGLSLGKKLEDETFFGKILVRWSELFPTKRLQACDANLLVSYQHLARLKMRRYAEKHGLPLLVWTVDNPKALKYWLEEGRCFLVTTNFPSVASRLAQQVMGPSGADGPITCSPFSRQ